MTSEAPAPTPKKKRKRKKKAKGPVVLCGNTHKDWPGYPCQWPKGHKQSHVNWKTDGVRRVWMKDGVVPKWTPERIQT